VSALSCWRSCVVKPRSRPVIWVGPSMTLRGWLSRGKPGLSSRANLTSPTGGTTARVPQTERKPASRPALAFLEQQAAPNTPTSRPATAAAAGPSGCRTAPRPILRHRTAQRDDADAASELTAEFEKDLGSLNEIMCGKGIAEGRLGNLSGKKSLGAAEYKAILEKRGSIFYGALRVKRREPPAQGSRQSMAALAQGARVSRATREAQGSAVRASASSAVPSGAATPSALRNSSPKIAVTRSTSAVRPSSARLASVGRAGSAAERPRAAEGTARVLELASEAGTTTIEEVGGRTGATSESSIVAGVKMIEAAARSPSEGAASTRRGSQAAGQVSDTGSRADDPAVAPVRQPSTMGTAGSGGRRSTGPSAQGHSAPAPHRGTPGRGISLQRPLSARTTPVVKAPDSAHQRSWAAGAGSASARERSRKSILLADSRRRCGIPSPVKLLPAAEQSVECPGLAVPGMEVPRSASIQTKLPETCLPDLLETGEGAVLRRSAESGSGDDEKDWVELSPEVREIGREAVENSGDVGDTVELDGEVVLRVRRPAVSAPRRSKDTRLTILPPLLSKIASDCVPDEVVRAGSDDCSGSTIRLLSSALSSEVNGGAGAAAPLRAENPVLGVPAREGWRLAADVPGATAERSAGGPRPPSGSSASLLGPLPMTDSLEIDSGQVLVPEPQRAVPSGIGQRLSPDRNCPALVNSRIIGSAVWTRLCA